MAAVPADSRDLRAQAQRNRILDAAQRCFAERGFHGASMAAIADTAQMSAGLIYRYFENKSALIHGIVTGQMELVARDVQHMAPESAEDTVSRIVKGMHRCKTTGEGGERHLEPALVLEITAESARDPVIGDAMASFNGRIDRALARWLATESDDGEAMSAERLAQRTLILRALLDGLKMRQAREPDMDLDLLADALRDALPKLMND